MEEREERQFVYQGLTQEEIRKRLLELWEQYIRQKETSRRI